MPIAFKNVYLESTGQHLPGEPVDNAAMEAYIGPINRVSNRIKNKILQENGIRQRHYAINEDGSTRESHLQMAAAAVQDCLKGMAGRTFGDIGILAMGSSGSDALIPGFASMLQGELHAPPMETLSCLGVCAAGISAMQQVAQSIELGVHQNGLSVASEMPSRLFKSTRFTSGEKVDFDAHFLRWMLSDGAGAALLTSQPRAGLRLKLEWIHHKSFSGDYPVCMQMGLSPDAKKSFLDFPSAQEAEQAGALALRQDIRLLPHLFDVAIHEYAALVKAGWVQSHEIDHFLCHYSSARFMPVVKDLLDQAGLSIPQEKWYSNLSTRGNTGAASIYIMLHEFLQTHEIQAGERIFCFVPESGRFTVSYVSFKVVEVDAALGVALSTSSVRQPLPAFSPVNETEALMVAPQLAEQLPEGSPPQLKTLLHDLAQVWQDYRSNVWRTPVVAKIASGHFSQEDYALWCENWVAQVRQGATWMRTAVAKLDPAFAPLQALIQQHAQEEQNDFLILYQDYQAAGGKLALDSLARNPGGEALHSYLSSMAQQSNPIGLLGAIYIIEGTGQRIVPALLPLLKKQLGNAKPYFRFLEYHSVNDEHHLARWLQAVELSIAIDPAAAHSILNVAKNTATLYLLQFNHIELGGGVHEV